MTATARPTCACDGTGWIESPNGGVLRCVCKEPKPPEEKKPKSNDVELAGQVNLDFALPQHEKSLKFHRANPHIYDLLLKAALAKLEEGHPKYGMPALIVELRYGPGDTERIGDGFKINDHHGKFYKKLLMAREPRLRGFFDLRNPGKKRK